MQLNELRQIEITLSGRLVVVIEASTLTLPKLTQTQRNVPPCCSGSTLGALINVKG